MSDLSREEIRTLRHALESEHPHPRLPRELIRKIIVYIDSREISQCQGKNWSTWERCPRLTLPGQPYCQRHLSAQRRVMNDYNKWRERAVQRG